MEGVAVHHSEFFSAFGTAHVLWALRIMAYVLRGKNLVRYGMSDIAATALEEALS